MNQNADNDSGVSRLIGKVAAEKKKAGIALCLVAIMTVMWVKVLTKKGPEITGASPVVETTTDSDLDDAINITYVDLPMIPGRGDLISRDFFASAGWQDFESEELNAIYPPDESSESPGETREVGAIIAEQVKLGATIGGQLPQAFINDKLMSLGSKFTVTEGSEIYECEVVEIRQNSVLIRCKDEEIKLKLDETVEGDG